jgi:hypothetical protein
VLHLLDVPSDPLSRIRKNRRPFGTQKVGEFRRGIPSGKSERKDSARGSSKNPINVLAPTLPELRFELREHRCRIQAFDSATINGHNAQVVAISVVHPAK